MILQYFEYAYVFTNYSELESGDADGVYEYAIKPNLHEFASFAFEDVCREYVREMQKRNQLPFRYQRAGGAERVSGEKTASRRRNRNRPACSIREKQSVSCWRMQVQGQTVQLR